MLDIARERKKNIEIRERKTNNEKKSQSYFGRNLLYFFKKRPGPNFENWDLSKKIGKVVINENKF